jgi:uroporphyrinogen-III synthase
MNATADTKPLAGRGIVVTRPAHQAGHLADLIHAAGGRPILFPVIEITAVSDPHPLNALIDRLEQFDLAIFVSPNAAGQAMNLIRARRALPPGLKFAAIGRASVRELEKFGISEVLAPARFDSEALLELPELHDIAGRRIVIFRGEGGRELLGETLAVRGAIVEYAECYRRGRPPAEPGPLLAAWARNELDAVVVTSSEGLRNFFELVGPAGQRALAKTPVFVPHPRIEGTARELGLDRVVLTPQGDEGLCRGLAQWFAANR